MCMNPPMEHVLLDTLVRSNVPVVPLFPTCWVFANSTDKSFPPQYGGGLGLDSGVVEEGLA
jgi:hypothetical protein